MNLLLDTHFLLWWLDDAKALSPKARKLIASTDNLVFISAVSVWELRIKEALGKIELPRKFGAVLDEQPFEHLSITVSHSNSVRSLPAHHRDPFDRMLIAQARVESLTLVTHDEVVQRYDVACAIV
ncbi:MAG: type II toxin-antitoxin system VapC family toxin [Deltaproteobacteria bacterium]|nr:type II toxin-antitoxin system VapC family toxin [Deltaproteobacteria bacterium]